MISGLGKRLAGSFGFTCSGANNLFFGAIGGYRVVVTENAQQRRYYLAFPARPSAGAPEVVPGDFLKSFAAGRKDIAGVMAEGYALYIAVNQRSYKKLLAIFNDVFAAVTGYLSENRFISCCMDCGETENLGLYTLRGSSQFLCGECAVNAQARLEEEASRQAKVKSSFPKGLIGAILGSLVGVVLWVLVYQLGYIVGVCGLAFFFFALKGYGKLGGCADLKGVVTSTIVSIVMLFAATYLCYGIEICKVYLPEGYSVFDCLGAVPAFLSRSSEVRGAFIADLAIGYIFMAAASIGTIIGAYRNALPKTNTVTRVG